MIIKIFQYINCLLKNFNKNCTYTIFFSNFFFFFIKNFMFFFYFIMIIIVRISLNFFLCASHTKQTKAILLYDLHS